MYLARLRISKEASVDGAQQVREKCTGDKVRELMALSAMGWTWSILNREGHNNPSWVITGFSGHCVEKGRNRETQAEATASIEVGDGGWSCRVGEKWLVSRYTAKPEPQIRCGGMRQREKSRLMPRFWPEHAGWSCHFPSWVHTEHVGRALMALTTCGPSIQEYMQKVES